MTQHVDAIIIGFGKAGKTLAGFLGSKGQSVVLVEKDPKMYGGTCINVGCIPSKKLAWKANERPISSLDDAAYYEKAMEEKFALISALNGANYKKVASVPGVTVLDGTASFVDDHTVRVATAEGPVDLYSDKIFINTGATPIIPEGVTLSDTVITSEGLLSLKTFPKRLTIIGGGFIGLEFASTYAQYGTKVTVLDKNTTFLPREDRDVADAVKASFEALGVNIIAGAHVIAVDSGVTSASSADTVSSNSTGAASVKPIITYTVDGQENTIEQDIVLVATGRKANTEGLNLAAAGVETDRRGAIPVNEFLQTNVPHIWALGDVNGGPNFTYISLDDFRVVKDFLFDKTGYSTKERQTFPTSTFIYPTLSQVGLTESAAREAGYDVLVKSLPVSAIPKAKIIGNQTGLYKAIIDAKTEKILGATLFAPESHEVINIIALAMRLGANYKTLGNQIFTHPTMAEALNDLFA
ncbi:MAG: FAD-dependent oxidoreductase [Veillonella sp.]|nr:FAD-dependent oxidoreductase [Veillonella sp.]